MKTHARFNSLFHPSQFALSLRRGGYLVLIGFLSNATAQTNQVDLSGQTVESIRNVLSVVMNHQLRTLQDGNYAPVNTLEAAANSAKPKGIQWNYPWGVTLYGMLYSSRIIGDTPVQNFVINHNLIVGRYYDWLKGLGETVTNANAQQISAFQKNSSMGYVFRLGNLDNCGAMGAQLMEGILTHAETVSDAQVQIGTAIATYIGTNYPGVHQARLADGTLWRPRQYNGTIWCDDLYMSCPFLIRWAQYSKNLVFLDDAASQIINMASKLQDTNGVWFHAYFVNQHEGFNHTHSSVKWGRANGWTMVTTVEVLSAMPTNHPARDQVLTILRRHIEGIKQMQSPSGMWYQVLDDGANPRNWEETSCTAMFAYSIARAVNRGWINPTNMTVAQKAFVAICKRVQPNGVVNGTCEGTNIGTNEDFYLNRNHTTNVDDMHGRGPVMLAGAEILLSQFASSSQAGPNPH
jgi:rhamnogalacturonyl hydrolase YesR